MTELETKRQPEKTVAPTADHTAEAGLMPRDVVIACDTEFVGPHTLAVQAAARLNDDTLVVQVYRSETVPGLPPTFDQDAFMPVTQDRYGRFCKRVVVLPVKVLDEGLSPVRMLTDLFGLSGVGAQSRADGGRLIQQGRESTSVPSNARWDQRKGRWRIPQVKLTFVGHFLRADFGRIHGRSFLEGLKRQDEYSPSRVQIRERKMISFVEKTFGRLRTDPLLEYLVDGRSLYEVRVEMRDTMLPYGSASLESHSQTFLGMGKSDSLGKDDKQDMSRTFAEKTELAYGYAMVDALNALLIYEQMGKKDRDVYAAFGFGETQTPRLRPTLGSRVSNFIVKTAMKDAKGKELPSERGLKELMGKGGVGLFTERPGVSRYGGQTGGVHGGLLYSRSPTKFWHESAGMLRDVDMSGCYQMIIEGIGVRWGRPVIFEPGEKAMTLRDAVGLVKQNADDDGWVIRVTGEVNASPNALIPSTDDAVTSFNYRRKLCKGKRRQSRQRAFHLEALRDPGSVKGTGGSRLYSDVVESGVVTEATWLMIQAMPPGLREQYDSMTADSVIFYPRKLVAPDGAGFDALVERYRTEALPWEAALDLQAMELVERQKIDADYVSLRYPVGEYARVIGSYRKRAQQTDGKGSGADKAWKVHVNTMYGALASPHLPTHNVVAANQITAQARAEAFAMGQALNAIQTITDGCTYRLDQVPACTFGECLKVKPDYPIKRAEAGDGIPFIDPATIPQDDKAFTEWYRVHVKRFFGVEGAGYDGLFGTHGLEHKKTSVSASVAFDALACDGSGNYAKCVRDGQGDWAVEDFAARSYRRDSKEQIQAWMTKTYAADRLTEPAPLTEDTVLLSLKEASQRARKALDSGVPEVYLPLGLGDRKVMNYKTVKPSAFVFRTPEQRASVVKQLQKFEEASGTGLEILALRRGYRGRREGSLEDVAGQLYQLIRDGQDNLKALNPAKMPDKLRLLSFRRVREIANRKQQAEQRLRDLIDVRNIVPAALVTAFVFCKDDLRAAEATGDGGWTITGLMAA